VQRVDEKRPGPQRHQQPAKELPGGPGRRAGVDRADQHDGDGGPAAARPAGGDLTAGPRGRHGGGSLVAPDRRLVDHRDVPVGSDAVQGVAGAVRVGGVGPPHGAREPGRAVRPGEDDRSRAGEPLPAYPGCDGGEIGGAEVGLGGDRDRQVLHGVDVAPEVGGDGRAGVVGPGGQDRLGATLLGVGQHSRGCRRAAGGDGEDEERGCEAPPPAAPAPLYRV
jgi:hypothetical protein